jgi:hypothetical protein
MPFWASSTSAVGTQLTNVRSEKATQMSHGGTLLVVNVSRWSAADHVAVLHDEQSAVGLVGEDFQVQMSVGTCGLVRLPCAISIWKASHL